MSKSIIQEEKECYICNNFNFPKAQLISYKNCVMGIEKHHIFFGSANRKLSEKYGLTVYLCTEHHRVGKYAVHRNINTDLMLKQMAQKIFMKKKDKTIEDFIKIFGKNYL